MYRKAVQNCSGFGGEGGGGFDGVCGGCVAAVIAVREALMDEFEVRRDDGDENAACGFAAVVAVAAGRIEDRVDFDEFFQCLPTLDKLSKNFYFYFLTITGFKPLISRLLTHLLSQLNYAHICKI